MSTERELPATPPPFSVWWWEFHPNARKPPPEILDQLKSRTVISAKLESLRQQRRDLAPREELPHD